jgi:SUF system NifU family Fe-S assembly protein
MMELLGVFVTVSASVLGLGVFLMLLPRLGRPGRAATDALARPPLLDLVLAALTLIPWIAAAVYAGWLGLAVALLGQMAALYAWIFLHELLHLRASRGPRIVHFANRIVGRWSNHLALWLTMLGVPVLWVIRLLEITIYPGLVRLLRFPRYNHADWVSLSRHRFKDLVGHDLVWCLYCDWMTGTWSLGTEMLRNVESFWCPIRFDHPGKLENCRSVFPDIEGGWVPADGSMEQVRAVLEQEYGGDGDRSWFGHPGRAPAPAAADHRSEAVALLPECDESLREMLLEHSHRPHNHRAMAEATHQSEGELPMCNDRLRVFLRLEEDQIIDISFTGSACGICMASASMMTDCLKGRSRDEASRLFQAFCGMLTDPDAAAQGDGEPAALRPLAGVHRFPGRVKCATLPWHTMQAALRRPAASEVQRLADPRG